ncbi:MAG: hypothetical protein ACTSRR_10930, partial [Candidatus Heimdallarchaeaceae archaeon]
YLMLHSKPFYRKFLDSSIYIFLIGALAIYMLKCNTDFSDLIIMLGGIFLVVSIVFTAVGFYLTKGKVKLLTVIFESLYITFSVGGAFLLVYLPISIISLMTGHATLATYIIFYTVMVLYPFIHILNTINIIAKEHNMSIFKFIRYVFSKDKKEYKERIILQNSRRINYLYENLERLRANYKKRVSRILTVEDILSENNKNN